MSVAEWCTRNGITKANYYYRLRIVRAACLEKLPEEMLVQQVVPVDPGLLQNAGRNDHDPMLGLDISIKEVSIYVTETPPLHLLASVLEVVRNAE